jgi:flagellar biosynthesis protein FlhG
MGKIISVTSGKGGVGKTMSTINMALAASKSGSRVLIVDGDLGLSNVDVVMGLDPRGTLQDVLDGHASVADIISTTKIGIDVISSGTGITKLANMTPLSRSFLVHELSKLPDFYDFVFVDTGAGISESVLTLNLVSDIFVVVTTPEPHAITDAYALIKIMAEEHDRHECALIVNQTVNSDEGRRVAAKIADVAKTYCGSQVHYVGSVSADANLVRAVLARRVGSDSALSSLCGQGWSQSWCQVLQLLNSGIFIQRSEGLGSVWQAISAPIGARQNLDP